jgi:hypothetical protein
MTEENKEISSEQKQKKLSLQKKINQRITIAKHAREAFLAKDYLNATKKYNEYLSILAEVHEVSDIYKLSPSMFDPKKDVTEMLLISHVYWELARINEMTPKLQKNFHLALSQFVKFTVNQPFQVLNAEMLRKYIKKNKRTSKQIASLEEAYQQIFVQSKKCYIASMCFGENSQTTHDLRRIKVFLTKSSFGIIFIRTYYYYSSKLVSFCENHQYLKFIIVTFSKPILRFISIMVKTGKKI